MYTDERLTCTDCGAEFVFTAGEQEFFASKGFQNKPNRCPDCRAARKAQRGSSGSSSTRSYGAREMYSVTCSECGQTAEVPFQPRGDKPVYCRDCYARQRSAYR
ncbi:MAG: zinc-ribbon domain containing protein [Candidatus Eremiobacteraeota bacterium]|nr:zinc-ribbon domain containing protein [Candidatus Eremiobacteraeota bacterium]MBV9648141.1 zinc-ribbon domain containing protein [Candidatus Eremiobacteraeota bacterium]